MASNGFRTAQYGSDKKSSDKKKGEFYQFSVFLTLLPCTIAVGYDGIGFAIFRRSKSSFFFAIVAMTKLRHVPSPFRPIWHPKPNNQLAVCCPTWKTRIESASNRHGQIQTDRKRPHLKEKRTKKRFGLRRLTKRLHF
ncbi:hypothetical protein L596_029726 [Steinernema carpocapsae]|uniref:Uncharacterized protein n=1 Tax=Steinernema carpocapsae TaxID=34508 RepID=A0A4U5LQL2_STECR|nr:hypothetical protein L596_029726 [Steinernema carpocapsae]